MPSPATSHRSSINRGSAKDTPSKPKPLDIGKQLGLYDTSSVREKVRLWQQRGGGVITADDIYVEDEDTGNPSKPKSGTDAVSRSTSRVDDKSGAGKPKPRNQNAPKKRVVSDEHWKIKRSPPRTPPAKQPAPPPKRITVYKTNDDITSAQPARRESKNEDNFKPLSAYRYLEDGTKVYRNSTLARRQQTRQAKPTKDDGSVSVAESKIEEEIRAVENTPSPASQRTSSTRPREERQSDDAKDLRRSTPPPKDDDDWAASEADFSELSRRRARRSYHGSRGSVKIPKGGIFAHMLDESRKMFAKPEPPPPRPNREEKIEAWLDATPDPFMDDDESSVEIPAPLKTRQIGRAHV